MNAISKIGSLQILQQLEKSISHKLNFVQEIRTFLHELSRYTNSHNLAQNK